MHQNLAVILRQFNYSKNSFIVLIPVRANDLLREFRGNLSVRMGRSSNLAPCHDPGIGETFLLLKLIS